MPHPDEIQAIANQAAQQAALAASTPPLLPGVNDTDGTWVPADGSGAGLVFTGVSASFFRRGKFVVARLAFTYPVTASGSNAAVAGLPFPTVNNQAVCQAWVTYSNFGATLYALPDANASTFKFYNAAGANLTNANLSGKNIYLTVCYETSPV